MRALVTGGAGFIGSHIVRRLYQDGHVARVLDNLSSGRRENLGDLEVELIEADVRDARVAADAVEGVDWVFHLAAMVSVAESMEQPMDCYQTNVIGSLNLLEAARRRDVSRVILSSSCAVYGDTSGPVSEGTPPAPLSPYAASKLAMEEAGRLYSRSFQLPVVSLRYFNVYGPRQSAASDYAAVIPLFIQQMAAGQAVTVDGDGRQTRDFIFVEDVVRANLLAAQASPETTGVYNVGAGGSHTILDLVGYLQQELSRAPEPEFGPARPGDIRHSEANLAKIEGSLGFRPEIELGEGLARTVEWFLETRETAEE